MWSFIDNFSKLGITFIIGIVLARILSPREFGLIGMITIFIAISQSFIDSGFTQALIRKKDCSQTDYSTVFFFNLLMGISLYFILYFSANQISVFFNESQLKIIIRVLALGLIINSFSIVQRARLTKNINFKLQTKISIISSITSGIIGIVFAIKGFGVWSLVIKMLLGYTFNSLLLWIWNKWKPSWVFSVESFKEMFSFGSRLLLSGLIDTFYRNIYLLVIGKFFSASDLGFYTKAQQFSNLPSSNITSVIQRVSYPVLASIQDDKVKLKQAYKKLIKSTMLITFLLMFGMAAVAKPMVLLLIGEEWLPSVVMLQLLCFASVLYPLHAINLNMLNVQGRSDLFLKLEVVKKIMAIPIIIIGIKLGINAMIIGMLVISLVSFFLNSYYSGKSINYNSLQQLRDISSSFVLASFIAIVLFLFESIVELSNLLKILSQLGIGIVLAIGISELFKLESYLLIKKIIQEKRITSKKKNDKRE